MENLKELLNEKTVFIFGAGTSKPYGFPLWEELKEGMISLMKHEMKDLSSDIYKHPLVDKNKIEKSIVLLEDSEETLDNLINKNAHLEKVFRYCVGKILIDCEASNLKQTEEMRIETFASVYGKLILKELEEGVDIGYLFKNFNICSFNYDRLFAYRFRFKVYMFLKDNVTDTKIFKFKVRDYLKSHLSEIHPHGVLGSLGNMGHGSFNISFSAWAHDNQNSNVGQPYGDYKKFMKNYIDNDDAPYIYSVDMLGESPSKSSYDLANKIISNAKNVIIVGMSSYGLNSCHLYFDAEEQNIEIYMSEKNEKKVKKSFVSNPIYLRGRISNCIGNICKE